MATYKEVIGTAVQSLANSTGTQEGQIWYDNANNVFKLQTVSTTGSWASGGVIPSAKRFNGGAGDNVNAMLEWGGDNPPSGSTITNTYDGTSWTTTPNSYPGATKGMGFAGIQTAALSFGGDYNNSRSAKTFLWNGSTWAAQNDLNTARDQGSGAGTTSAAFYVGGNPGPGYGNNTETWDGSCWTNSSNLPYSVREAGSGGTVPAGWLMGGLTGAPNSFGSQTTEFSSGTWTSGNNVSGPARWGQAAAGPQTAGWIGTGNSGTTRVNNSEAYDGTSWSSNAATNTAVIDPGSAGNGGVSGGYFGGEASTGNSNVTEEYSAAGSPTTVTLTTS